MSCGETVVQKGAFGESVFFSAPEGMLLKHLKTLEFVEKICCPFSRFGRLFLRTTPSPLLNRHRVNGVGRGGGQAIFKPSF